MTALSVAGCGMGPGHPLSAVVCVAGNQRREGRIEN